MDFTKTTEYTKLIQDPMNPSLGWDLSLVVGDRDTSEMIQLSSKPYRELSVGDKNTLRAKYRNSEWGNVPFADVELYSGLILYATVHSDLFHGLLDSWQTRALVGACITDSNDDTVRKYLPRIIELGYPKYTDWVGDDGHVMGYSPTEYLTLVMRYVQDSRQVFVTRGMFEYLVGLLDQASGELCCLDDLDPTDLNGMSMAILPTDDLDSAFEYNKVLRTVVCGSRNLSSKSA